MKKIPNIAFIAFTEKHFNENQLIIDSPGEK